jgi:hypothetical protein
MNIMSTLEKVMSLLQDMPEQQLETVYTFTQLMTMNQTIHLTIQPEYHEPVKNETAFGIAHKYANPNLIEKEEGVFEDAMAKKHAINRC